MGEKNHENNLLNKEENITVHLAMIQDVIKRMADNSFKIKGWGITLVSALLGLLISNDNVTSKDLLILLIPIIGFMAIDTFYLKKERIFRKRYEDDVKKLKEGRLGDINFLSLSGENTKEEKTGYINVIFSSSILLLYLPLILSIFFIMHVIKS